MKKSKKNLKYLIALVVVLLVIFLIMLACRARKNDSPLETSKLFENLPVTNAKAQSYVAYKIPSLNSDDKILGSKDAPLKIFVYEDTSNLYSARLADTLDKLYAEMPSQLAIIFRPFISKESVLAKEAALAVECAGDENKWIQMRALLFAKTKNTSLAVTDFGKYAEQVGLDKNIFSSCLTNQTKSAKIEKLNSEASGYNVIGAPTIFIDDEMIPGARPYEDYVDSNGDSIEGLKSLIAKKLK